MLCEPDSSTSARRLKTGPEDAGGLSTKTVTGGLVTVPCEIVYVLDEPNRAGFGYGTLPGHVQRGEEAFLVERDQQDRVWFRVTAFSRPARWITVLGGPLTIAAQRGYAALLGRALTRLSRTV